MGSGWAGPVPVSAFQILKERLFLARNEHRPLFTPEQRKMCFQMHWSPKKPNHEPLKMLENRGCQTSTCPGEGQVARWQREHSGRQESTGAVKADERRSRIGNEGRQQRKLRAIALWREQAALGARGKRERRRAGCGGARDGASSQATGQEKKLRGNSGTEIQARPGVGGRERPAARRRAQQGR